MRHTPAPWCCEAALSSFHDVDVNGKKKWAVDSGANGVIVPKGDELIVDRLPGHSALGTSGGVVSADNVLVETPWGVREGLEVDDPDAPRLFPAGETDEFRKLRTATIRGVTYDLEWQEGIPFVCPGSCHTGVDRRVAFVTMRVAKGSKRTAKRRRKQERKPERGLRQSAGAEGLRCGGPGGQ